MQTQQLNTCDSTLRRISNAVSFFLQSSFQVLGLQNLDGTRSTTHSAFKISNAIYPLSLLTKRQKSHSSSSFPRSLLLDTKLQLLQGWAPCIKNHNAETDQRQGIFLKKSIQSFIGAAKGYSNYSNSIVFCVHILLQPSSIA